MSLADIIAKQKADAAKKVTQVAESAVKQAVAHTELPKPSGLKLGGTMKPLKGLTPSPATSTEGTGTLESIDQKQELTAGTTQPPAAPLAPTKLLPGEVPASESDRVYEDDATEDMKKFGLLVDSVPQLFEEPEMLQQVIRTIMLELTNNPEFMPVMTDADITTMMRAMRDVLGLAQIKKAAGKKKKAAPRKSKNALDAQDTAALDDMFAALGK